MTILMVYRMGDGTKLDEITGWMRPVRVGEQIEVGDHFYVCRLVRWRRHEPIEEIFVERVPSSAASHERAATEFSREYDIPLESEAPNATGPLELPEGR